MRGVTRDVMRGPMPKLPADESGTRNVVVRVGGARARLRAHFLSNIGRIMDSAELRPIADNISGQHQRMGAAGA